MKTNTKCSGLITESKNRLEYSMKKTKKTKRFKTLYIYDKTLHQFGSHHV